MPILRRIVFGEPKPGEAQFADLLKGLDESVSYCNRGGPLQHDRVTDLPFTIPALGLDFVHPTDLTFICGRPVENDPYGIFGWHHMPLYEAGMAADAGLNPLHLECVRLCSAIYARPDEPPEPWDECRETDGVVWAVKFDGNRAFVVFRGSVVFLDWIRDVAAFDPNVTTHSAFGKMWSGFMEGMSATWAEISPRIDGASEVIFTGHSLGAARADVVAGYALLDRR